jgi:hypothetical protein
MFEKTVRSNLRPATGLMPPRGGTIGMETIRPDSGDPMPLRLSSHRMSTLMIRFVGFLLLAVAVLALIWSR